MNVFEHPSRWLPAVAGGIAGLLGGYDLLLQVLLLAIALDVVVGTANAFISQNVNATVAFRGGFRKLGILVAIALATILDRVIVPAISNQLLRTAACAYYIAVEGVSITGHLVSLGVPLPPILVSALQRYKQENEE